MFCWLLVISDSLENTPEQRHEDEWRPGTPEILRPRHDSRNGLNHVCRDDDNVGKLKPLGQIRSRDTWTAGMLTVFKG